MGFGWDLNGWEGVYCGDSGGWGEDEVGGFDGDVFFHVGEAELGGGAVGLFELHALNGSGGGDDEGEETDALGHSFGDAGDFEVWAFGGGGEGVEFFGQLGVAEEEAERGAEVVELLGGGAGDLGVAGGVEPGVFAVKDEELAGG